MRRELSCYLWWFEHSRPHQGLDGRTPQEVYDGVPVVESSKPKAKKIPRTELVVRFHEGRTYQYFDVPEPVYTTLIGADSIGQCFNRDVRLASYAYHRLT